MTSRRPEPGTIGTVWPTGETDLATQLERGGYRSETTRTDPAGMPPAIAAYAIGAFTGPGDLVLDPDCGAGTTVVEALCAGRHAIGLAGTRHAWQTARANVTAAKAAGAPADGMVLVLDRRPNTLRTAHIAGFAGSVDLILTTFRPPAHRLAPLTLDNAVTRLRTVLGDARTLLRPAGHVVVVTQSFRDPAEPSELIDVPDLIASAATEIGLVPVARCVALTVPVATGRRVRVRLGRAQRAAMAAAEQRSGHPAARPCHQTVLVLGLATDQHAGAPRTAIPPVPRARDHRRDEPCLAA